MIGLRPSRPFSDINIGWLHPEAYEVMHLSSAYTPAVLGESTYHEHPDISSQTRSRLPYYLSPPQEVQVVLVVVVVVVVVVVSILGFVLLPSIHFLQLLTSSVDPIVSSTQSRIQNSDHASCNALRNANPAIPAKFFYLYGLVHMAVKLETRDCATS